MLKEIFLETMDGYQFQEFVARLFRKLGFSDIKVGPRGADMGIDLTMIQKVGMNLTVGFAVQCKHHPKSVVSRPVVQKLHSAIIVSPDANKGIIVASGHFSSEAIKYAEEVGIELIDGSKLVELGKQAGIPVLLEKEIPVIENCFPISSKSQVIQRFVDFLESDLTGFKRQLFAVNQIGIRLIPTYMIDYCINATFSTSVGVVHSIHKRSSIFILGDLGKPIHKVISEFFLSIKGTIAQFNETMLKDSEVLERRSFRKSFKEVEEIAVNSLIRAYSREVSYYGRNNVRYVKNCVPRRKHVTIEDIKRVYLAPWGIVFSLKDRKYVIGVLDAPERFETLPGNLIVDARGLEAYPEDCMTCLRKMEKEKYLCNECGKIVCRKDNSQCKICGKTICREHTISKRRLLVLSSKYCSSCAKKEGI